MLSLDSIYGVDNMYNPNHYFTWMYFEYYTNIYNRIFIHKWYHALYHLYINLFF